MDMLFERKFRAGIGGLSMYDIAYQLQECAQGHVQELGLSSESLLEDNILWVLVKSEIHIKEMPADNEEITALTWPGKTRHGVYPRRFEFRGEDGRVLLTCATQWVLMDSVTREFSDHPAAKKLQGIKREGEQKMPASRIDFPELTHVAERKVTEDEIDINGHLNNCYYLGYADELLKEDFVPSEIWIQYDHEILEGETVEIKYEYADNCFYAMGVCSGTAAFYLRVKSL